MTRAFKIFLIFSAYLLILSWCAGLRCQTNYALPNVNSGCPSNCRQITWVTGSDIWNGGSLPTYSNITCTLTGGTGSDNSSALQTCINNLSSNQCAFVAAGTYLINGTVRLKSNTCVRGAKQEGSPPYMPTSDSGATTFQLGASGTITTQNFSFNTDLSPGVSYAVFPSTYALSGAPQKGDTSITTTSGTVSVGTWIKVFGNDNPALINDTGTDGTCNWCGDATGWYVMQQIVQVTAITSGTGGPGSTITISPALYYTPYTVSVTTQGKTEPAGAKYNIITFPTQKAGLENIRIDGSHADIGATQIILLQGCLYCWVKNVETYDTGSSSASAHMEMDFSYGNEIRDSAFHDQRSGASGSGYGVYFQFVNSDHKIENNVLFHNRHSIVYQGGGSGTYVGYNFMDDNYTDDSTYLGSARTSHGAHPFMNLFEGNIISHITADDFWGTTSHDVFFRNWIWGGETNTSWPAGNLQTVGPAQAAPITPWTFPPNSGFTAVDLFQGQEYYAYVDNVLGTSGAIGGTGVWGTWSAATLSETCTTNNCGYDPPGNPGIYSYGGSLGSSASSSGTIIRQGNYDFKTNGVAFNDGGSGFTYQPSYYYASQPSFIGTCSYPAEGSDLTTKGSLSQPAYQRAIGGSCGSAPLPPTNVGVQFTLLTGGS